MNVNVQVIAKESLTGLGTLRGVKGHRKKRSERYFFAELDLGTDGKGRQVSRGVFETRRAAEAGFAAYCDETRWGRHVDTSKVRLQKHLENEWIPAIKASETWTHAHYRRNVGQQLIPPRRDQRLLALPPAALNAMYADLLTNSRADGTGGP